MGANKSIARNAAGKLRYPPAHNYHRPMTTDTPPPRRKWHFNRWLIVFIIAALGWSGWRAYAFRSALKQAEALGWDVRYTDPAEEIRQNWRAAFKKETWLDGVGRIYFSKGAALGQHQDIISRLNPRSMESYDLVTDHDISALKDLTRLEGIFLHDCARLTNIDSLKSIPSLRLVLLTQCTAMTNADAFKDLSALRGVGLVHCTELVNVDGLKNLAALKEVVLEGGTALTNVDALMNLSALEQVSLENCTRLTNVDAVKNLSALKHVYLKGCTGLINVDGLKNLSALQTVSLDGCTALTPESIAALKAALPNAEIIGP